MNKYLVLVSTVSALLVAGCGQKESTAPAANAPAPAAAAAAKPAGPRVIEITGGDNMKFNITAIDAKPGEELKIIFSNIGTMPKEAMGHNLVILKKGTDTMAFAMAATTAKATDYIPASMKDAVLAHTTMLGPRKSEELLFTAPTEPGDYPYVCSFPAHYQVGMKGIISVK